MSASAVALALAVTIMACGGGGNGGDTTVPQPPTYTPTTAPSTIAITSNPEGAIVELNPQKVNGNYVSGSGRTIGVTPVQTTLQPGDFVIDGGCGNIIVFVHSIYGYYGAVDLIATCMPSGASGTPVPHQAYTWTATLDPCPADIGPYCGNS